VKNILQGNNGINKIDCKIENELLIIVTIKLIDPNKDDKPAICKLKNNKSIDDEFIIDNGI